MPKTAKRIILVVAAFIVVVFTIFLFNQTTQIVQSARAVNVVFGNGVMWGLIFTYCILLTTPLALWFRLPKRILPPETTEGAEYDRFLADSKKRLSRHPRLRGHALNSTTDIETALQKLDKHADDVATCTTKDRRFGTLCSYMQTWLRQLLSLLALRISMSMCWLGRFSARLLLQFRECIFSPVLSCPVQRMPS